MNLDMQGHVYPPYRLKPDRALARKFLTGQGVTSELPERVPPSYMIFLRGETRGVDLFKDLEIPRQKALHGGQRYEWLGTIGWDDEIEATATIEKVVQKERRGGKIWFADVAFEYVNVATGKPVLREITRLIELG